MKGQQVQQQEQITAYQKKSAHNMLLMTLEWLEKYIEVVYPNCRINKQIRDNNIKRTDIDGNPAMAEDSLATQLVLFRQNLRNKPPFLRDELKEEYYRWINATGINANSCPERLKHFLFGINELLEGRGEKILEDLRNEQANINSTSPEFIEQIKNLFALSHSESKEIEKVEKSLAGKTHKDIDIKSKFGSGDVERGGQTFQKIAGTVSNSYETGFHFFPQQEQQSIISSGHPTNLNEVVQEVKTNHQNWTLDEIATEISSLGRIGKKEISVYCRHARLDDYNQEGKLNFNNNPIYLWKSFNSQQRFEIKKAKNISSDYLTNEEIKWVVREVIDNPSIWRIGVLEGCDCLAHSLAQGKDAKEVGTLIHRKQEFSNSDWAEIDEVLKLNNQYRTVLGKLKGEIPLEQQETHEALEIYKKELEKKLVIKSIKQNIDKWEIKKGAVALERYGRTREGMILIVKNISLDNRDYDQKTGELINQSGKFYKQDYFDEQEQAEINVAFTSYENRQIIEIVKNDVNSWKIEPIQGNDWLIHDKAQRIDSEIGSLLHSKQRFADEEWNKIKNALNSRQSWGSRIVSSILPTNFGNRQNYKLEVSEVSQPQKDNKLSISSILAIIGVVSAVAIAGVIVGRKKLNKKVKSK